MCASAANFYVCLNKYRGGKVMSGKFLAYNVIKLSKKIMKLNAYKQAHESNKLGWAMKTNALFYSGFNLV